MNQCVNCKGKGLCGRPKCPVLERFKGIETITDLKATSLSGASPPSVFVGRRGYPDIFAGPLIPPDVGGDEAQQYEDPGVLLNKNIDEIIGMRSRLVRSYTRLNVGVPDDPFLLTSQELAMADAPVDAEAWFARPPAARMAFDGMLMPMGPAGELTKITLTENPKVPAKIDYLVSDTDVVAVDSIRELHRSSISQQHITRIFSIGLLGRDRKLVPTRWSITAIDDMVGKMLLDDIRYYPEIKDIVLFTTEKFGNHFEILLVPRCFSFELIEVWLPDSVWSDRLWIGGDREEYGGKRGYSSLAGGYYAARTAVVEYLHAIKRQASVFIVREIRPDYWAPLGVWVIREAVRDALTGSSGGVAGDGVSGADGVGGGSGARRFDSIDDAFRDLRGRIRTPHAKWQSEMQLLDKCRFQRTLTDFW
ncbi:MAG: hypothetical protein EF813_05285 [Methanosarcinales archaeon]|nr:MAG: hypothetical protein EF813_05285 [Methanosarcinales archaeon]